MPPRPRPPQEKSSDPLRRGQILEAAERLLRHYGPNKTTIGDIAREAGIGVGSVYLEFCSKDEIVGELAARRHDRVLAAMRTAAARHRDAAERLAAALEARVEALFALSAEGAHSCDLVLCSATSVKVAYGRFRAEELAFVAALLDAGNQSGELEVTDAKQCAELVQRAHASLSPPWLFEQEARDALRTARALNRLLLSGLIRRSPAGARKKHDKARGRP